MKNNAGLWLNGRLETDTLNLANGHREKGTNEGKHYVGLTTVLKTGCEELRGERWLRQLPGFCCRNLCIRHCENPGKTVFFREGCFHIWLLLRLCDWHICFLKKECSLSPHCLQITSAGQTLEIFAKFYNQLSALIPKEKDNL